MIIFLESYKPGDFSELVLGTSPSRSRGTVNKHLGSLLQLMESPVPPQAYYGLQNFQSLEGLEWASVSRSQTFSSDWEGDQACCHGHKDPKSSTRDFTQETLGSTSCGLSSI